MPVSYKKLFALMNQKGVKKVDLRKSGISPTVVDRLIKDSDVNISTIMRLCEILHCQPGDIMEYIDSEGFSCLVPTMEGAKKLNEIQKHQKRDK